MKQLKELKVGDRVKTIEPNGIGVIVSTDSTVIPYEVVFNKPVYWDNNTWTFRWFFASSVTLLSKIQNKLK